MKTDEDCLTFSLFIFPKLLGQDSKSYARAAATLGHPGGCTDKTYFALNFRKWTFL